MKHPYIGLPDYQFWNNDPGIKNATLLDPVALVGFSISKVDRIVTAGSCFAQHVGAHLAGAGFNYHVTESAHPVVPKSIASANHYGQFSARYGNVYTARQLRQLIDRAYGNFAPQQISWTGPDGSSRVDPFRPQIQPGGFVSDAELLADRAQHYASIRKALESMNVFVFTLGLTEAWEDVRDGAIFPIAPGVAGGRYAASDVRFRNFDETESYEDLLAALSQVRTLNPFARIILTVSPVPLNATYENRHVLVSTTWSKSVLRIVAENIVRVMPNCDYFPSFEIVTSPHVRGRYFAEDCRQVLPEGVAHVMRVFLSHYAGIGQTNKAVHAATRKAAPDNHSVKMEAALQSLCDEEAIENK